MDAKEVAAITAAVQEQLAQAGAERARGQRSATVQAVIVPIAIPCGRGREATIQIQLESAAAKDIDSLLDAIEDLADAGFTVKSWPKKHDDYRKRSSWRNDQADDDEDDDNRSNRRSSRRR